MAYLKKVDDATAGSGVGGGWFKISEAGLNVASKCIHYIFGGPLLSSYSTNLGRYGFGKSPDNFWVVSILMLSDRQQGIPGDQDPKLYRQRTVSPPC